VLPQCVNFDAKTLVFLGYVFSENDPSYVQNNNFIQPPINPTPRPYLRFMLIHTSLYLGHVGGGNRCGGYTLMRVTTTCWLTGLWSTKAKVGGIVLKAAWHWGSDSSVVNNPLWGTRPHPIVRRPSVHMGLRGGREYVFCFSWEGSLLGTLMDINE